MGRTSRECLRRTAFKRRANILPAYAQVDRMKQGFIIQCQLPTEWLVQTCAIRPQLSTPKLYKRAVIDWTTISCNEDQ